MVESFEFHHMYNLTHLKKKVTFKLKQLLKMEIQESFYYNL